MTIDTYSRRTIWITFARCLCSIVILNGLNSNNNVAVAASHTEQDGQYWLENGKNTVVDKVKYANKMGVAKNIIMFLGDGMSLTTLTASRIYKGQMENRPGESEFLSFEKFPFVGMSKTYCVDKQVADSACTSTAYLTGVKANYETIGVTAKVKFDDCYGSIAPENRTHSIAEWSLTAGKAVGLVTTTRVTHASPAGAYAHIANRNWESDTIMAHFAKEANLTDISHCEDIAKQLVTGSPGKDIKVILGGGRQMFYLNNTNQNGSRLDMDLVKFWKDDKVKRFGNNKAAYVENRDQLLNVDSSKTDYLLGLFADKHMKIHSAADPILQPTLAEMTKKAVEVLKKQKNGFFLFVESGLIDYGHHKLLAKVAMDETVELSKAVQQAVDMTSEDDTLIVVTSDHSHTMTMAGYPKRGNDISGLSGCLGTDNLPYTTLSYANGPQPNKVTECVRSDLSKVDTSDRSFVYPKLVPLENESHGGDDVMVFARGPWAHLFSGTYEQNVIPLTMGFAAGVGPAAGLAGGPTAFTSSGFPTVTVSSVFTIVYTISLSLIIIRRICA